MYLSYFNSCQDVFIKVYHLICPSILRFKYVFCIFLSNITLCIFLLPLCIFFFFFVYHSICYSLYLSPNMSFCVSLSIYIFLCITLCVYLSHYISPCMSFQLCFSVNSSPYIFLSSCLSKFFFFVFFSAYIPEYIFFGIHLYKFFFEDLCV